MVIRRFEDIDGWKLARQLTAEIYATSKTGAFKTDFGMRDQIRRAAVSVMANIAEGFGRKGSREFARYLTMAQASSIEIQSHLTLLWTSATWTSPLLMSYSIKPAGLRT